MKKLFSILAFLALSFMAKATVPYVIWTIADSGATLYITKGASNSSAVATFSITKPFSVNTQNSFLYIKDGNAIIYPMQIGKDSITIDGAYAQGGTAAARLTSAERKVRAMIPVTYKNYTSAATTVAAIKAGRGFLHIVSIDSVGVGGKTTCTIWDAATTADTASTNTPIFSGVITTVRSFAKDYSFKKGIVIKQKTTTAGRVSVSYYLVEPPESYGVPDLPFRYHTGTILQL